MKFKRRRGEVKGGNLLSIDKQDVTKYPTYFSM